MADDKKKAVRLVRVAHEDGKVTLKVRDEANLEQFIGTPELAISAIHADVLNAVIAAGVMSIAQTFYSEVDGSTGKLAAIEACLKELTDGTYKPGRTASGETPSILLAIHEVLTKAGKVLTIEEVEETYEKKDKAEKTKIARRPDVMIARARIDKEREAKRLAGAKSKVGKVEALDF